MVGLTELRNCLYASYVDGEGQEYNYFTIVPDSSESNESIWKDLAAMWKSKDSAGAQVLYKKIPYQGLVGIVLTEEGIYGVSDVTEKHVMLEKLRRILE